MDGHRRRGLPGPAGLWFSGKLHSCRIQGWGLSQGALWGRMGVKKYRDPGRLPRQGRQTGRSLSFSFCFWCHIWSPNGAGSWAEPVPALPLGAAPSTLASRDTLQDSFPCQCHPLRGLSLVPLGLPALSLFLRRRLSIQLELERVVKPDSARELSRIFLPDMMSSPKPSWCEKA